MNLPAPAESLCLARMAAEQAAGGSNEQLFLYIGLTNGVCQRVRSHRFNHLCIVPTNDDGHDPEIQSLLPLWT